MLIKHLMQYLPREGSLPMSIHERLVHLFVHLVDIKHTKYFKPSKRINDACSGYKSKIVGSGEFSCWNQNLINVPSSYRVPLWWTKATMWRSTLSSLCGACKKVRINYSDEILSFKWKIHRSWMQWSSNNIWMESHRLKSWSLFYVPGSVLPERLLHGLPQKSEKNQHDWWVPNKDDMTVDSRSVFNFPIKI